MAPGRPVRCNSKTGRTIWALRRPARRRRPALRRGRPQVPVLPIGIVLVLLITFLAMQRRLAVGTRVGYAAAGVILFASVAAGLAGCSGAKSSAASPPSPRSASITAVYSG